VIAKSLPFARRKVFRIMIARPLFPVFGEDLSLREEFAALSGPKRLTLRDHGQEPGRTGRTAT
jgi:hypothetical protein